MDPITIAFAGGTIVFLGLFLLIASFRSTGSSEIASRLSEYVSTPVTQEQRNWDIESAVRHKELQGSFAKRTLVPAFKRLGRLFGRLTPAKTMEELNRQLTIAGSPLGLGPREFYGMRLLFLLAGSVLAFQIARNGMGGRYNLLMAMGVFVMSSYLPKSWLKSRMRKRQSRIRKGLPDALDMLSVCAQAGLGFDQSLQRVSEYWKTPIGVEFGRVVTEMEMGFSRQAALRNLSDRSGVTELTSFVAVILQSDQLGMSIADTLHAQSHQMREERRFRAQEQARKIPLKMLFPMLLLILPAMFAVILGPSIPVFIDMFAALGNSAK